MSTKQIELPDPASTVAVGLRGAWGQVAQFGAIGAMILLLLGGGVSVFYLVREERLAAQEDRAEERRVFRELRQEDRDLMARMVQTMEKQSQRLDDLARICERIERRLDSRAATPKPESIESRGPPAWLARLVVAMMFDPEVKPDGTPSKTDVGFSRPTAKADPPSTEEPKLDGPIRIPVGRFAWAFTLRAIPVTYAVDGDDCLSTLTLDEGTSFPGVKFDEPKGARPKHNPPPTDAKGQLCVLLGTAPGRVTVSVWANVGEGKPPVRLAKQLFLVVDPDKESTPDKPKDEVDTPPAKPPLSALAAKLKTVYSSNTDPDKKILIGQAILGMEWAAQACADRQYADVGALEAAVNREQKKRFDGDRLKPFGPAIAESLLSVLPNDSPQTPLTDELRAKLKAGYSAAAAAYREVIRD